LYKRANQALEGSPAEERLLLLEQWKQFEQQNGTEEEQKFVEKMIPKRVKKRRQIIAVDGTDAGWEEYFDYIFPQDQGFFFLGQRDYSQIWCRVGPWISSELCCSEKSSGFLTI